MKVFTSGAALVSVIALTGCHINPAEPGRASGWVTATVQGSTLEGPIETDYSGTGWFTTTPNARRPAAPAMFLLQSHGSGAAQHEGFEVQRKGSNVLAAGAYGLAGDDAGGPSVVYTQRRGNVTYRYGAESGELIVHDSSADRVTGTFRFTGVFIGTCTATGGAVSCTHAGAPDSDAPRVLANGTFEVTRSQ